MQKAQDGKWAILTSRAKERKLDHLRIRLSHIDSGELLKELNMPLGLVNIILNTDCRLSPELEAAVDGGRLRKLISQSLADGGSASLETGESRVDVTRE